MQRLLRQAQAQFFYQALDFRQARFSQRIFFPPWKQRQQRAMRPISARRIVFYAASGLDLDLRSALAWLAAQRSFDETARTR